MEHSVTIKYNKIFFLGKRKRKSSITPARISIRHGTDERIRERQTINCRDQYTKLYFTDYYFPHRPSYSLVEQQPEEKRKQAPRLTRSISWRAGQISQRTAEFCCPFARTKGSVSSIIKTLRFSPPQRSASGLFRQWRIVQSSLETSSLDPCAHTTTNVRVYVRVTRRWLSRLANPTLLNRRLTFSVRGDGVGFGHGSMEGGG